MRNASVRHHCSSLFQLACQVPAGIKKTNFDAVDGYHAVLLDVQSQPLKLITEWGRYIMYLRLPQGFVDSGDKYNRQMDEKKSLEHARGWDW